MARTVGLVLGSLMLLNGIFDTLQPRLGFRIWQRNLQQDLPQPLNRMYVEYSQLSNSALRFIAIWELAMAGLVLWLASRVRE